MIKKVFFLLMVCQLSFGGYTFAQQAATSKSSKAANEKNIVHKIAKGETIFSICKKYNIDQKELINANPSLSDGLKTGEILTIPRKESPKKKKEKKEDEFLTHTVKKGETLFSIAKKYSISIETIVKFNPDAKDGVKTDQVLQIPGFADEASADDNSKLKKEATSKTDLFDYEVEEGDTFFGLLRKFGITKDQLLQANPGIQLELKVGQQVKVPKSGATAGGSPSQSKYIEHKVEPGETIYGLSAEYDVKVFEIMEINPGLEEKGLVSGATIYIPRLEAGTKDGNSKKEVKSETKDAKSTQVSANKKTIALARDTFRITMFLPLFLNENFSQNTTDDEGEVTDSTSVNDNSGRKGRTLYSQSRNFLNFYEGFLIALDTMKKTGVNIVVDVHDNEAKQAVVDEVMRKSKLQDADLIVGPVDVKHQKNISNFSYKNQIPLVSPFSSDDDFVNTNPFYFQVNPTKDYIYRKTADFIGRDCWDKNVIVMTPYSFEQIQGGDIVELVREKLRANASKHGGSVKFAKVSIGEGYWEAKDNLRKDIENVVFILPPTNKAEREAIFSRAINSLYVLAEDYDITVVGMSEYLSYKSINTEYYHKLKLHYLTPNFIDYTDPEVNAFISAYRKKFLTEPNQFSYRGYDIAKYFLEAYRTTGRSYLNKIGSLQINTLQSSFKMKRVKDFSGFMNRSLFVVNYTPEYEVKAVSTIGD
jgi:LysM repeat protein